MSSNTEESLFWLLAKKYSVFPVPLTENLARLNETEVPVKVVKHASENSFTIMEDIFALKEKTRQLEHKKSIHYHSTRSRSLNRMLDSSIIMIENMNTELKLILHKKHVILRLLQNATLKKDILPIPGNLHRTFIKLLEDLLQLSNIKINIAKYFFKLSDVDWDKSLRELQPLKQQTLRTISIFSRLLYDACELQNSLHEMLLSTTQFVPSFIYDLDVS
jgi:hypothetical protein